MEDGVQSEGYCNLTPDRSLVYILKEELFPPGGAGWADCMVIPDVITAKALVKRTDEILVSFISKKKFKRLL